MSARNTFCRTETYNGPSRNVSSSGYGDTEKLLRDLRSELLIEKKKRLIAENIASDLTKQLKALLEKNRTEGNRRTDAETRIRDLELQLRAETENRKKAKTSREQLLLGRLSADLLPSDLTSGGRNFSRIDRVGDGRQSTNVRSKFGYTGALHRISSSDCHEKSRSSSSNSNNNDNVVDDDEWQSMVRYNADILQKSGPTSATNIRKRILRKDAQRQSASESTERRNAIAYFTHQNKDQGTGPTAEHTNRKTRAIRESTHSSEQMGSGRAGGYGRTHMVEQISKREGRGNTPGVEYVNKSGAHGCGITWVAKHTSMEREVNNCTTSESNEDGIRKTAKLNDSHGKFPSKGWVNEAKKLLMKQVSEPQTEAKPKELHQNPATSTALFKNTTDVTDVTDWSGLSIIDHKKAKVRTDSDVDPAFTTNNERRVLWQQRTSLGQADLYVQSPGGMALENGRTGLPIQSFMKLKAKWESTPSFSEA